MRSASKAFGYGLSMILLALASLMVIPALIRASGDAAYGALSAGQVIGSVGAVVIGYGWGMAGPAIIARTDADGRRAEYVEAMRARLFLCLPVCLACCLIGAFVAGPGMRAFGAIGALAQALVGMSGQWYFVGIMAPYWFLVVETVPRVLGTLTGWFVMNTAGASAVVGTGCQCLGIAAAIVCSTAYILARLRREGAAVRAARPVHVVLREKFDGVAASITNAVVLSLPMVLVSFVNPAARPMFAFVDRVQRQIMVALTPLSTVMQGWVPRGDRRSRGRRALLVMIPLCALIVVAVIVLGPFLTDYLGDGVIRPGALIIVLMALFVALGTYETVLGRAVLTAFGRLRRITRANLVSGLLAAVAVGVGVHLWGAEGALIGVVLSMLVRIVDEYLGVRPDLAWAGAEPAVEEVPRS
ncbi:lipopolysaccharide biosynthesis protein [Propionibacterium australiense]|uniref:Polysaccharide biosynthesis protein n=1 Tax=Propionibacterium australiense TaxID=119981 RepID=A0A383S587_9ACTN|nr:hypothetical protein [Propionibacterium australiense]RLP10656.1 hypothetical protein D9T14_05265 [Propionibacterium australiense]RLP12951.1 hypothetical protein D7U36_00510 [Propionibacterium australiense]SYZ32861.1 Hypothetical protein PROPAUS_0772 [Propionibacterium australiense]VEH91097.1 Uncharacterised protein [Propionibacterium australiense]